MKKYAIRDLLNMEEDMLWSLPEEYHTIVFDDGNLKTHTRATITSVYLMHPLRHHPEVSIPKRLHLGDRRFTSKSMIQVLNDVVWHIFNETQETIDPEYLAKMAFDTTNHFYNVFTIRLSDYVATLSMFDCLDVMNNPDVKEANETVEPTQHSIENVCYPKITKALMKDPRLNGNPLAESARSGTLKLTQILQCMGPRGFTTDVNSTIFPHPITKGYFEGIDDLYGSMIESRSGSKALFYNATLLSDTEYFNRKTQLAAQSVRDLEPGDCGTPYLIDFPITESTLPTVEGKYYITSKGKLDWIRGDEKHLIGTCVKMRSVLGCVHPNPAGICMTCYGRLAYNIPHGTNVGQVSAVITGDKITSSVLSTKHSEATSKVDQFVLHRTENKYLRFGRDEETLYLKPFPKWAERVLITVDRNEVRKLADILLFKDLSDFPVNNASEISQLLITLIDHRGEPFSEHLRVSLYNRNSSFSQAFLAYLQKKAWAHDAKGNVVIDITKYGTDQPFLTLPFKHVNMFEVMIGIQTFLHSGSGNDTKRLGTAKQGVKRKKDNYLRNYEDPVNALIAFSSMLNEKLSVNLVHSEIMLYAMMVRDRIHRDYRLPIPGIHGQFEKYNTILMCRSLGATMAFERQYGPLIHPGSFMRDEINDHPYDTLLMGGKMDSL